jgi:hypothetical protein
MKRILMIALAATIGLSASAQKFGHGGVRHYAVRPHVVITTGIYSPFYPYYGYYGNPYYPFATYHSRPSRLELQIADIKQDYQDKIWSAKHDEGLTRKEKKIKVHELRSERDKAILDAKKDYYKVR